MGLNDRKKDPQLAVGDAPDGDVDDKYAVRRLTFAENLELAIKVLIVAGLLVAVLWGLTLWTAAE